MWFRYSNVGNREQRRAGGKLVASQQTHGSGGEDTFSFNLKTNPIMNFFYKHSSLTK